MYRKTIKTTALLVVLSMAGFAQLPSTGVSVESGVLDGVYVQEHIPTKRVIAYAPLREADVMWSKRVWRTIDLREKQNHKLYYPEAPISDRMSLFDLIKYAVLDEGSLTVYELGATFDDQFKFPVQKKTGETNDEFKKRLEGFFGTTALIPIFDENGDYVDEDGDGVEDYEEATTFYEARDVIKYEIKEDWFFDKQRSVMDVRIIGISPVVYDIQGGEILGQKNLGWFYFPECRYVFQNFFVYNPHNDAQRMSFDDLFWKRDFASFIHKESNIFDRSVNPTWTGVEALLESERVKGEIFELEHDLWHL